MKSTAIQFGNALDSDDFELAKQLLEADCNYLIGDDVLTGPDVICQSYEQNMIAGRKKLDKLEWGQSAIETISTTEYYVLFTDYLLHKGQSYTHRCKQKLTLNDAGRITRIEHINDSEEQERLNQFYISVGLKS